MPPKPSQTQRRRRPKTAAAKKGRRPRLPEIPLLFATYDAPEPEERWRYLGEIDPATGRSTVDISKASGWRPIEEFWRW